MAAAKTRAQRVQTRSKGPADSRAKPASDSRSPLAPKSPPRLAPLAGVRIATGAAGIRYKDRTDVLLVTLAPGTQVAGVFTKSKTASAPVEWCRAQLPAGTARALVVNSGNANAFTGKAGEEGARRIAESAAAALGCSARDVFMASTGVIGEPLPAERIARLLASLAESGSADGWRAAADAILTTDTFAKLATASAEIDGRKVTINGIAKGSGMIAPDMATMLAFVFTDASLPAPVLQDMLSNGVKTSFNAITVDSDTSTSDTLLLFATGKGAHHAAISKPGDKRLTDFRRKLDAVLLDLALQVVRDGEGAQKLIRIDVSGAESDAVASSSEAAVERTPLQLAFDAAARAYDPRIKKVRASYADELRNILVVTSDGTIAEDSQPLARLNASCIAKSEQQSGRGSAGGGGRVALDFFFGEKTPEHFAKEAARQAILQLDAREAPAGEMEVVLGPGWPGVLLHEAVGHGLEADFNRKKTSAFAGLVGRRVASEKCTVVDNGTMPWRRGSLNVDDEGQPTQETVLIENGILKGYLSDKLSAKLMGISDTGNGRRESYEHIPMPRMTNTYMLPGQDDPEDIIRSVKHGVYAVNFGGGQVDITNGKFVFSASEAYMIEDGKITAPIKGATLIGNGPDVLTRVSMVGHDLQLDEGVGTCGKDGQAVPVGVGIPTIKVDRLTVGGTARKDSGGFMQ